jgi:hypothetical protein
MEVLMRSGYRRFAAGSGRDDAGQEEEIVRVDGKHGQEDQAVSDPFAWGG